MVIDVVESVDLVRLEADTKQAHIELSKHLEEFLEAVYSDKD